MSLTRAYEEHEVTPELKRLYSSVRTSFDLPFVPTIFKLTAGMPDYLRKMWDDLGPVVSSKEFQSAAQAFQEVAHSSAVSGGWTFSDQSKVLAAEKFSNADIRVIGGVISLFARASCQMALFSRLAQRGYSGGQRGRVSGSKQVSALSQLFRMDVPNERDAGLRVWLIYSDIRKTTGSKTVVSLYRVLSSYPGYLASAWLDSKKLLSDSSFISAREDLNRRARSFLTGLPVKDHRAMLKDITPAQWREIEETMDSFARTLPQFVLLTAVWQRSFPNASRMVGAA
jgi:hypothetical protein